MRGPIWARREDRRAVGRRRVLGLEGGVEVEEIEADVAFRAMSTGMVVPGARWVTRVLVLRRVVSGIGMVGAVKWEERVRSGDGIV